MSIKDLLNQHNEEIKGKETEAQAKQRKQAKEREDFSNKAQEVMKSIVEPKLDELFEIFKQSGWDVVKTQEVMRISYGGIGGTKSLSISKRPTSPYASNKRLQIDIIANGTFLCFEVIFNVDEVNRQRATINSNKIPKVQIKAEDVTAQKLEDVIEKQVAALIGKE